MRKAIFLIKNVIDQKITRASRKKRPTRTISSPYNQTTMLRT
ncbi:hypothetical protein [Rubritalea tangerina]